MERSERRQRMNPRVLFLITSDPRSNAKPAEAVRIAAGVGMGKKVHVAVCFLGAAVLVLGDNAGELIDGDHFIRYLSLVPEAGGELLAPRNAPWLAGIQPATVPFREIGEDELAETAASSDCVLRF